MSEWRIPVFDRTREDVEYAIKTIAEWVSADMSGNPLAVHDLKGCLNVSDINRIEGNIAYLATELTRLQYPPSTSTREWTNGGLPNEQDIQRILANISGLTVAFYAPKDAPPVPDNLLGYEEVNAVEKNISLIKELLDCMVGSFKKSGTHQSGKSFSLPIRR